ncbi:hypothetical protein EDD21DRAFT_319205 [Dissophora ornata]|nr:hypothetical protein EDD21DRAFT_319205 [Dissophora ornata]
MYSHQKQRPQLQLQQQQQSNLSRSLPPTPSQPHPPALDDDDDDDDNVPDDYFGDSEEVPLPFPIKTIVADPQTGLSLTLISALGAGSYAVVYLAKEVASGTLYALKCLGKDKLTDEEVAVQRNEVVIHTSLPKHQNIIHLFNMFETTHHLFLLLEYSSGMDMYQWISMGSDKSDPVSGEPYSLKTRYHVIKTIFDQVLEGVGQVHMCGVAHRDLKPENFLIELANGEYTVKLTDFGLATTDSESDEFDCGSKPYMSFECRNGIDATYDVKLADVWSLGIILINLLYHRCPWSDPCPQKSITFSEFLKSRVDFLQRRFEDMPGSVARWLGLRSFAFVGSSKFEKRRSRPGIDEWKLWMNDFVPRMLGQIDSTTEEDSDYDDRKEYREYLELYENDLLGEEVEGDEILDSEDEDEVEAGNQIVPISIQPSPFSDKQYLHLDPGRAYASYHAPMDTRMHSSFNSSSMPKFDPSSFYQPTRLRQESWSDAIDMEGTEDAEMDFSAPILFEESDEDEEINLPELDDDDDSAGLAVALPDDFINPLPESSAVSSGRQTPSTPTPTHLNFNSEKRQLPAHLRCDLPEPNSKHSTQESSKRSAGRGSPLLELNDQINTLVFIEPDVSNNVDTIHSMSGGSGHAIALSLPSTSHMEASLGVGSTRNMERALLKQQMRKPARNLQDVKAAPFVFPPLKAPAVSGNPIADSMLGSALLHQNKTKSNLSQQPPLSVDDGTKLKDTTKTSTNKSGVYVIPKRSQVSPWANPSQGLDLSRSSETNVAGTRRNANWRRGHHRGGSWASTDDVSDSRKDAPTRYTNDGARTSSGRWRVRLEDKEEGRVGLPPRVENKFRPRYRQGRQHASHYNAANLPPIPPILHSGFGAPRSRHQSQSGTAFDHSASLGGSPLSTNDVGSRTASSKDVTNKEQPQQQQQRYEHSQLRTQIKAISANATSRLAGQRNKSLVDLRAINATNQPWRQPISLGGVDDNNGSPTMPTMVKARSQVDTGDGDHRKGAHGIYSTESSSTGPFSSKTRLTDRLSSVEREIPKDNVYHPPQWHERNNSSSSNSLRRPSSGYESDFTGWQKHDDGAPLSFSSKNRSASKGHLKGHQARELDEAEPKKIVKPSTMIGLGNMPRGLVAYYKNIKAGGEATSESDRQPHLDS